MSRALCLAEYVNGARKVCLLLPDHPGDHLGISRDSSLIAELENFAQIGALRTELDWCRERLAAIAEVCATGPVCAHLDLVRAALSEQKGGSQ